MIRRRGFASKGNNKGTHRISSAPLRISLAGGGTDIADFASVHGGRVVGFAVNHRVEVEVISTSGMTEYELELLHYQSVRRLADIESPFAREAIRRHGRGRFLRMRSDASVAAGSGLGSSAAFTLATIAALSERVDQAPSLLEECAVIEEGVHGRRLGLQEQAISMTGGFVDLRADASGFEVERIAVSDHTVRLLADSLLVMHTGTTRSAGDALKAQVPRSARESAQRETHLAKIKELAAPAREALERGDVGALGELLRAHWDFKIGLSDHSDSALNAHVAAGLQAGAIGGKLSGAGAGGTVVFIVEPSGRAKVCTALELRGLKRLFAVERGDVGATRALT